MAQRGGHDAAGNLVAQEAGIETLRRSGQQAFGPGQTPPVVVEFGECVIIDQHVMPRGAQVGHHRQGLRQRAAIACRAYADVHGSDEAQVCCCKARQTPQPDGVVGVYLEALVTDGGLHGRRQRADALRRHEAARVLQVEQVDERAGRERAGEAGVERVVMQVGQREGQCAHHFGFAFLFDEASRFQHGIGVMHRVQHDETTDAVALQVAIHQTHEIRVGLLPGDEAQAGGNKLQRGARHGGAHAPDAFPRVVAEVTHGHRHMRR